MKSSVEIVKYLLMLCLVVGLASCGGPVGTLKSGIDTITIDRVDLTDRLPVGCDLGDPGCTQFNANVLMVWFTSSTAGVSGLMSARVTDSAGQEYGVSGNGLLNGAQFISFSVPSTSSGFQLHWLENPPLRLGK